VDSLHPHLLAAHGLQKPKISKISPHIGSPHPKLCCDQFGGFIKDFELCGRPSFAFRMENVRHLGGLDGKNTSYPSNHATNISHGIAFLFSFIYSHP